MWRFFATANHFPEAASLNEIEARFRTQKLSGVVEKITETGGHSVQLIAGGVSLKLYELAVAMPNPQPRQFHAIPMEDEAARLIWLALESRVGKKNPIPTKKDWNELLSELGAVHWSGLLEFRSYTTHGFILIKDGEMQPGEFVIQNPSGFLKMDAAEQIPFEVTLLEAVPDSHAYQCFVLRKGITIWTDHLLVRCQEMIGRRMLQTIERELNHSIEPWNWHIALKEDTLQDAHFFPSMQEAANAYRAVFMGIGTQLNFFIGNNITQRILNESFELLPAEEKNALNSQRLIPAAFTL